MIKKVPIIILILFVKQSHGQADTGYWSIGLTAGVERAYRMYQNEENNDDQIMLWDSLEKPVLRAFGGVRVMRNISKRFELQTGLMYSDKGYKIDSIPESEINSIQFHYRYLDIPVGGVFKLGNSPKYEFIAGATIGGRFLISQNFDYRKDAQTATFSASISDDVSKFSLNVSALLGYRKHISDYSSLDILIDGNQSLTSIFTSSDSRYVNSIGIRIGINTRI